MAPTADRSALKLAPVAFVALWSTGFITAELGTRHADPLTLLSVRFAVASVLIGLAIPLIGGALPRRPRDVAHLSVVGVLLHGGYLGGTFYAVLLGMPPAIAALIVGLQPILTAFFVGPVLGERMSWRHGVGLALGFAGIALVLAGRLEPSPTGGFGFGDFGPLAIANAVLALLSITAGVIYQKRFCADLDLVGGTFVQYAAAGAVIFGLALVLEDNRLEWTGELIFALAWMIGALSLGAISLLMLIIRAGEASRVTSLFYLAPPLTALMAYLLFQDALSFAMVAGMVLAGIGVMMVQRSSAGPSRVAPAP
ncbi:MAG: DMT family transporter [Pseudomonadota bacterium]